MSSLTNASSSDLPPAPRQLDAEHVGADVEMRVILPIRAGRGLHRPLAEPLEAQEAIAQGGPEAGQGQTLAEAQHAADHHQIAGAIHAQPRGIHAGHALRFLG